MHKRLKTNQASDQKSNKQTTETPETKCALKPGKQDRMSGENKAVAVETHIETQDLRPKWPRNPPQFGEKWIRCLHFIGDKQCQQKERAGTGNMARHTRRTHPGKATSTVQMIWSNIEFANKPADYKPIPAS